MTSMANSMLLRRSSICGLSDCKRTSIPIREWPLRPEISISSDKGRPSPRARSHMSRTSPRKASEVREKRMVAWTCGAANS